jgi:hypothetical protein
MTNLRNRIVELNHKQFVARPCSTSQTHITYLVPDRKSDFSTAPLILADIPSPARTSFFGKSVFARFMFLFEGALANLQALRRPSVLFFTRVRCR